MKVKVKATGEIVDVERGEAVAGNNLYGVVNSTKRFQPEELEPAEPDWQHYRIQAAIAAMSIVKGAYNIYDEVERFVHHSVRIADALITELQKKGEQQ